MTKFIIVGEEGKKCWSVSAEDKHKAIAVAVNNDYAESMSEFYYGYEDGQISVYEVEKELVAKEE